VRIYTKSGDSGETSLFSGGRVAKDHLRVEAYGCLDELSSVLGMVCSEEPPDEVIRQLRSVQGVLLSVGAAVADVDGRLEHDEAVWNPTPLESWIDLMEASLEPLQGFILPGGGRAASCCHLARTVCRRAERRATKVAREGGDLPAGVLPYLNRLSDALFVLARHLNRIAGVEEPRWESPGP